MTTTSRTVKNGLRRLGIDAQVGPGSDYFLRAQALANELTPLYVNTQIKADEQMPDTATGAGLTRQLETRFRRGLRPAAPAAGWIVLDASATTTIPVGVQLIDDLNQRYDADAWLVRRWRPRSHPSPSTAGRQRTTRLATRSVGGSSALLQHANRWSQREGSPAAPRPRTRRPRVNASSTTSRTRRGTVTGRRRSSTPKKATPIVQKGFAYPVANGPSTQHIAVVGYASSVGKSRAVDAVVMSGTVVPYVLGKMPEFVETVTTTVADVPTDIALGLTAAPQPRRRRLRVRAVGGRTARRLAAPRHRNGWPQCNVTAVTSTTGVQGQRCCGSRPDNVSRICLPRSDNWTLYRAKVHLAHRHRRSVDGGDRHAVPQHRRGARALGGTGSVRLFQTVNMDTYVAEFLAAMALDGPGEKTRT